MKIRCNYLECAHGVGRFLIHPDDRGAFMHDMTRYGPKDILTVEVKKYKPLRTLTQNAFFHKTIGYLARELGMDAAIVKEGIKDRYGYQVKYRNTLIPKPSHLCNRHDEMSALIEGCFREAGEQGVDMRDYVLRWDQFKTDRKKTLDKKNGV